MANSYLNTFALKMKDDKRQKRLEEAIKYLMSLGLIDGRATSKSIAEKMDRGINSVSSALNGDERYLTWKFIKNFCAAYGNVVSSDWIWDGSGVMLEENMDTDTYMNSTITNESLMKKSKEDLVRIISDLMQLHREQQEMYRLLIRQNDEMIRNGQKRFKDITNIIFRNV